MHWRWTHFLDVMQHQWKAAAKTSLSVQLTADFCGTLRKTIKRRRNEYSTHWQMPDLDHPHKTMEINSNSEFVKSKSSCWYRHPQRFVSLAWLHYAAWNLKLYVLLIDIDPCERCELIPRRVQPLSESVFLRGAAMVFFKLCNLPLAEASMRIDIYPRWLSTIPRTSRIFAIK